MFDCWESPIAGGGTLSAHLRMLTGSLILWDDDWMSTAPQSIYAASRNSQTLLWQSQMPSGQMLQQAQSHVQSKVDAVLESLSLHVLPHWARRSQCEKFMPGPR